MTTSHGVKNGCSDPVRGSEPEAAKAVGISFPRLLETLVKMALKKKKVN